MTTVGQYRSRKSDVLAFDGAVPQGKAPLEMRLAGPGEGGKVIAGVEKLVQRFLLELLTERGSMPYAPDRGTRFLVEARLGLWRTHVDVQAAFARAVSSIRRRFHAEATHDDPPDERLDTAEVLQVAILPGRVQLTVALRTAAGFDRDVLLPLSISF